jgi:hypothetical protein
MTFASQRRTNSGDVPNGAGKRRADLAVTFHSVGAARSILRPSRASQAADPLIQNGHRGTRTDLTDAVFSLSKRAPPCAPTNGAILRRNRPMRGKTFAAQGLACRRALSP